MTFPFVVFYRERATHLEAADAESITNLAIPTAKTATETSTLMNTCAQLQVHAQSEETQASADAQAASLMLAAYLRSFDVPDFLSALFSMCLCVWSLRHTFLQRCSIRGYKCYSQATPSASYGLYMSTTEGTSRQCEKISFTWTFCYNNTLFVMISCLIYVQSTGDCFHHSFITRLWLPLKTRTLIG